MRTLLVAALCIAASVLPASPQSYPIDTSQNPSTPKAGSGASYDNSPYAKPTAAVPQNFRVDVPAPSTPANGTLSGTAQRDSSACCASGSSVASVQAVAPTGSHTGSPSSSGYAPESYFCLTEHNGWPLNSASPNQCKFKSNELKMAYCTCGAYSYYDTYYVNMPGFGQTNSYDVAVNYACRGYDYYQQVYYTCGTDTCSYSQGYCAY